jgi:hypothetical protein
MIDLVEKERANWGQRILEIWGVNISCLAREFN